MRDIVRHVFHDFSAPLEGREVPFMYLDSADPVGFVTIATGCLIDPVSMAVGLPFVHPDGRPATNADIVACWSLVKARQDLRKHGGMIYGGLAGNTLRLPPEATRNLVDKRLTWFDAALAEKFSDWATWPACAQLFALSWAWAVGVHAKYPLMLAALHERDFLTASEECTINPQRGTIVTRNARNRILLRNAARIEAFHLDPDLLDWEHVLGVSEAETLREVGNPDSEPTPADQPTTIIRVDPSSFLRPDEWDPPDDAA